MTTREARKNLCKLMSLPKATCIHSYKTLSAVLVPAVRQTALPAKVLKGTLAGIRRWKHEQMHAALTEALKGEKER